ncbi:MAG TPA: phospholipase D-like domain-containing protein, partial [Verrucomicrobiae bacterium]|nr:phospholipase D-like domain-containing protein [Verrucomicrobiae bacterium]
RDYWRPLTQVGGEFRWFNPLALKRISFRDHRKILACDGKVAFIGGFNIAPEYDGDGVTTGWRDLGMQVTGPLVADLVATFDHLFANADFKHPLFMRFRPGILRPQIPNANCDLLLARPGRGGSSLARVLRHVVAESRSVDIVAAYFLPPPKLRRALQATARRGGKVRLILPAKSDVTPLQWASRGLYQRLLRAGVEIYEYQPQVLHAKLVVADNSVFVGSANLDPRSFNINYELLVRIEDAQIAAGAREIFEKMLPLSQRVDPATWRKSRTFWHKLRERWARFVFVQVDVAFARRQLRYLT